MLKYRLTILICLVLISACTSTPSNPRDPFEPMNRSIYNFNDKADRWVMKPVAQGYHDYTPSFFRRGIDNFFSNLNDANSSLNYALQGEGHASAYNFSRFIINSTVGLLGFIDVASGHDRTYEQTGFGDTFSTWGWKNSSYLVVPLMGPSTLRDGAGVVTDATFRSEVLYGKPHEDARLLSTTVNGINTRAKLLGLKETIDGAALDPYSYVRDAWLQMRAKKTGDTLPKQEDDDFNIDDLVE